MKTAAEADAITDRTGEPRVCLSCGERAMLEFCAVCGEKRAREADFSMRRFLERAVETVTNVDSRIGRTFALLVRKPGHLTAEYFRGRRRPYLDPLQLFLICNVVFFAFSAIGQGGVFTTSLSDHLHHHPYSPLLLDHAASGGTTFRELLADPQAFQQYAHTYNVMTSALARSLVVLMVPMFALVSYLLYRRQGPFFAQHLVFALHFWAFLLLLICAVGLTIFGVKFLLARQGVYYEWQVWDAILGLVMQVLTSVYLVAAGGRAFAQPFRWTVPKAIVLTLALLPIIWAYRFILFFATVAAI